MINAIKEINCLTAIDIFIVFTELMLSKRAMTN